jgi:YVTN family beta-propeller protein
MKKLLLIFTLVLVFLGCGEEDKYFVIHGTVIDAENKGPVSGANVKIHITEDQSKLTDSDGRFRFEDVPSGEYEITVAKVGYETYEDTITVRDGDTLADVSLNREKPTSISGVVIDAETGLPLSKVEVYTDPTTQRTTTDEQGNYIIEVGEPRSYTVKFEAVDYEPKSITIDAKRAQKNQADAKLTPCHPKLKVIPESLFFSPNVTSQLLTIENAGTGTLRWKITVPSEGWLTATPTEGDVAEQARTVNITVDRKDLACGTLSAELAITSNGGTKTVAVTVKIECPSIVGTVTDTNGQPLADVTVSITPDPQNTRTDKEGKYQFWGLAPGNYTVKAEKEGYVENEVSVAVKVDESVEANIKLKERTPLLNVTPSELDFGIDEEQKFLTIRNADWGILTWKISNTAKWISAIVPSNGTTEKTPTQVRISIDRSGLNAGRYEAELNITSDGGAAKIKVKMVVDIPTLRVESTILDFGISATIKKLTIMRDGYGSLNWRIDVGQSWIKPDKQAGTVKEPVTIDIEIDRSRLPLGDSEGKLTVYNSDNRNDKIDVTVKVKVLPSLTLTVFDARVESPIDGAIVEFDRATTQKSNAQGEVELHNIEGVSPLQGKVVVEGYIEREFAYKLDRPQIEQKLYLIPIPRVIKKIRGFNLPNAITIDDDNACAYVTNFDDDSVSKININADMLLRTFDTSSCGEEPLDVAVNLNKGEIYVVNSFVQGQDTISMVSADFARQTCVKVGNQPVAVAVSPGGEKVYVANQGDNTVTVIDLLAENKTDVIKTGRAPSSILPIDDRTIYVTNFDDDTVWVIDTITKQNNKQITVGHHPIAMALSPSGRYAYVVNNGSSNMSVIDAIRHTPIVPDIPVGSLSIDVAVYSYRHTGDVIYVTNSGDSTISMIITNSAANRPQDVPIFQNVKTLDAAYNPRGVAISENGKIYAVMQEDSEVWVYGFK